MATHKNYLKNTTFSDNPINWFLHAQAFHYSGLKMVEAYEKLPPIKLPGQKGVRISDSFKHRYTYKVAIYLLAHAIELLLKGWHAAQENGSKKKETHHDVSELANELIEMKVISLDANDKGVIALVREYLIWFGRYYKPKAKSIDSVLNSAYEVNDQGLSQFKYPLEHPESHIKLDVFFKKFMPEIPAFYLDFASIWHYPE